MIPKMIGMSKSEYLARLPEEERRQLAHIVESEGFPGRGGAPPKASESATRDSDWSEVSACMKNITKLSGQSGKTNAQKAALRSDAEKVKRLIDKMAITSDAALESNKSKIKASMDSLIASCQGVPKSHAAPSQSYAAKSNFDGEAWHAAAQARSRNLDLAVQGMTSPQIRKEAKSKADMRVEYLRLISVS